MQIGYDIDSKLYSYKKTNDEYLTLKQQKGVDKAKLEKLEKKAKKN